MENNLKNGATAKNWGRRFRWLLIVILFIFIIIQFFQPEKNNNDVFTTNDITSVVDVPDSVQQVLDVACYDCHSNNTRYPWYTNIQPVGWWLQDHIKDGKRHLNFNEFAAIPPREGKSTKERQIKKLHEIKETVEKGEMPLSSYTIIHKEAVLSKRQKQLIVTWADTAAAMLERK